MRWIAASAGDPIEDLLKFSLEVAPILPARTRWWQALFEGYGQEPEYALFRLRLLGCSPDEFACVRPGGADQPWEEVVRHVLAADTWLDLFADGW